MNVEILSDSLLQGDCLHCQPVENGPIVTALIHPATEGMLVKKVILCPLRKVQSRCGLRMMYKDKDRSCHYKRGDGKQGGYQIIGPNMDQKLPTGYISL